MTDQEKLLAMCALKHPAWYGDIGEENARLLPIIKALLSDRERLREALEASCVCTSYHEGDGWGIGPAILIKCDNCKSLAASQATDDLILKGEM